jgi:hypothetical protein
MFFDEGMPGEGATPSEIHEIAGSKNLERQMEWNDRLTGKHIDQYVDRLIDQLKKITRKKQKVELITKALADEEGLLHIEELSEQPTAVVVSDLTENKILAKKWDSQKESFGEFKEDKDAELYVIQRIRQAVIERLKERLVQEDELKDLKYSDINFITAHVGADQEYVKEHVSYGKDLNATERIVRTDRVEEITENEHDRAVYNRAVHKLLQLPKNDYIVNYAQYDAVHKKALVEKLNLAPLHNVIYRSSLEEVLTMICDGMKGAEFLKDHGLVLQDISIDNIGVLTDKDGKKRGVLFDLEGIYIANEERTDRFGKTNKTADGTTLPSPNYFAPEIRYTARKPIPLSPMEMVYQFGMCLKDLKSDFSFLTQGKLSEELQDEYLILIRDMAAYDARAKNPVEKRISLEEALQRLQLWIAKYKVYSASHQEEL